VTRTTGFAIVKLPAPETPPAPHEPGGAVPTVNLPDPTPEQ
jgi:hypothetical protein